RANRESATRGDPVENQATLRGLGQSRPFVVAMSASFPAASASVHHDGANWSRTIRPPAASPAAIRASACSYGTQIAMWIAPPPSARGSFICSNQNGTARPCGSTRSSAGLSRRGSYPRTERQYGINLARSVAPVITCMYWNTEGEEETYVVIVTDGVTR